MRRPLLALAAAAAMLLLPAGATAGVPYTLGNVGSGKVTVTAGPAGVYHVVWNDQNANVYHYCQVLKGKGGCAKSTILPFNDADGGITGAPDKAWIVRDIDQKTLYLVHPQYVSGDTYVWTSVDDGTSFTGPVKVWGGVNGTNGTDSQRPLYFPAGKSIAFPSVNTGLYAYEVPVDGSAAASEARADLDQTGLGIRSFNLGLASVAGGTLATADNLENVYAWKAADGDDLAQDPVWGAPKLVGPGYDSTMHGQAGDAYLGYTARNAKGPRFEIRKWTGSGFGKPTVIAEEPGRQASLHVSENGAPGAVYRENGLGLQYTFSDDGGKTFDTKLVTKSDEIYFDLLMAHDDDGSGLAVWTRNGSVAAADLTEVADPTAPERSTTVTKKGRTIGLNVPGSCVLPGKKVQVTTGGQGKGQLVKVRYSFGSQVKTDKARPWGATFVVPKTAKAGATIKIRSVNSLKAKSGSFTITITSSVDVCGG